MEGKTEKNTTKKFAFRKRRSSKGKKDTETPVDQETEQGVTELVEKCEETPEKLAIDGGEEEQASASTAEEEKTAQSSAEDPSPKNDDGSPPSEAARKKKSKRRSLFRRKKNSEKVNDGCEPTTKAVSEDEGGETLETHVNSSMNGEQVVCEDSQRPGEITDQSDGEGYLSMGEASEVEGEALLEGKGSASESATAVVGDKGTKRKSFFKRGLSLKRRKSKKQTSEAKEDTAKTEPPREVEVQTETTLENASQTEETKAEVVQETSGDLEEHDAEATTHEQTDAASSSAKNYPAKPPRKVSFVGPDGTKLDSSDEGDSLTEHAAETGDESETETITTEDGPSEESNEVSETVVPEVVVMPEDAGCSEAPTEGDDDDLTEVSSMSSSLFASSDAPDTISTSDVSRLQACTDTDDTGSRITLEGISEESEAESKPDVTSEQPEIESKLEVSSEGSVAESKAEDTCEESGCESKPEVTGSAEVCEKKSENEATKLLGDGEGSKVGGEQWEMVNRSNDMSVELQRVRKQTLFSVKRLCCSVM